MKEFKIGLWFVIRLLLNCIFGASTFKLPYLKNKHGYKKQIFWEGGGGYYIYYMGICKAIHELYSQETIQDIVWVGSSAGNVACMVLLCHENSPQEAFQYLRTSFLTPLSKLYFNGFYNSNKYYHDGLYKWLDKRPQTNILAKEERNFASCLHLNILFPFLSYLSYSHNYNNIDDMTTAHVASQGIPLLLGSPKYTFLTHPSKWYIRRIDGGVLTMILGFIFGYKNIMPYGKQIPTSSICVNTLRPLMVLELWAWNCPKAAKVLFDMGYNDAINNPEIINKIMSSI